VALTLEPARQHVAVRLVVVDDEDLAGVGCAEDRRRRFGVRRVAHAGAGSPAAAVLLSAFVTAPLDTISSSRLTASRMRSMSPVISSWPRCCALCTSRSTWLSRWLSGNSRSRFSRSWLGRCACGSRISSISASSCCASVSTRPMLFDTKSLPEASASSINISL
jgi:hypothetical protein